jgi:hypothetical protein
VWVRGLVRRKKAAGVCACGDVCCGEAAVQEPFATAYHKYLQLRLSRWT